MKLSRLIGLVIFGYFLYFAAGAVKAGFSTDDMMNMRYYYERGLPLTVWNNVEFWSHAYRPLAGLFYLPIYYTAGLNPLPCIRPSQGPSLKRPPPSLSSGWPISILRAMSI